jgi:hypothetical protein
MSKLTYLTFYRTIYKKTCLMIDLINVWSHSHETERNDIWDIFIENYWGRELINILI